MEGSAKSGKQPSDSVWAGEPGSAQAGKPQQVTLAIRTELPRQPCVSLQIAIRKILPGVIPVSCNEVTLLLAKIPDAGEQPRVSHPVQ